jgi:hypothetical protein
VANQPEQVETTLAFPLTAEPAVKYRSTSLASRSSQSRSIDCRSLDSLPWRSWERRYAVSGAVFALSWIGLGAGCADRHLVAGLDQAHHRLDDGRQPRAR